ncbi:hypothetical protein ANN_22389 [Periplaneta americana]|uniref:Uncharacterized protein n=1 Tax=Periplaneta americana TaxID=6978 RepID=A0ABQ8S807_PERAM|nr:hypothetical protein ANN_22389 [Periplaneta americana]
MMAETGLILPRIGTDAMAVVCEGGNEPSGSLKAICNPEKSQPKKKIVAAVDSFDEEVIRRLIYNFYATHKQRPTLQSLLPRMDISVYVKKVENNYIEIEHVMDSLLENISINLGTSDSSTDQSSDSDGE